MSFYDYSIAFQENQVLNYSTNLHYVLHCQQIGSLSLPSGKVIARDPLIHTDGLVLDPGVSPGSYPVFVTTAFQDCVSDIAFAALRFAQTEPVRWEPTHGKDEQGRPYGYGVDSATGSFMDSITGDMMNQLLLDDDERLWGLHEFRHERPWTEFVLPQEKDAKVYLFRLNGDGGYPSYYGYDAHGMIVCIVTDFFGLERQEVSLWPATLPAIPTGFDAQFFTWLSKMNSFLQFPGGWGERESLSQDDLQFLEHSQGTLLPEDFRLHYLHSGSWLCKHEPLQEWWPLVEAKARANLKTERPLLPVVWDWNGVAVCDEKNHYSIYEQQNQGWDSQDRAFEYPDLKTYLMELIMRDLGTLKENL
ncbi:DUF4241 domain-containing protein [Ktedonospora formicarum]|uniref:Uncharacterized protein n=1 Tax=Ktedonospora formicarum TaxID=2778364 RepID=A0A8J3IBE7_9CHLR|nr:DUF4241 domain-containing protein [Ktedonospora formicarum]GHO50843.1 hypothetical protein KSX_90060 [Ktedonospora formicarum]